MTGRLCLPGLDGANPLGFLATLGVIVVSARFSASARLCWYSTGSGWRPEIRGCGDDESEFLASLHAAIASSPTGPFTLDKKLPFAAVTLHRAFEEAALSATRDQRYECDLLAALGTDAYQDDNGNFLDTAFRMVRSGDAAGQGFPVYALAIRQGIDTSALKRAMFTAWDYRDEGFSLRWDPVEDQRYALRWYDPSPQSNKKFSLRTMRGANVLALEGLSLLPVQPGRDDAQTTGFSRRARRREFFTWPIWEGPVSVDVVRSLVALPELGEASPPREKLKARGIAEVYRCERIAPSQ